MYYNLRVHSLGHSTMYSVTRIIFVKSVIANAFPMGKKSMMSLVLKSDLLLKYAQVGILYHLTGLLHLVHCYWEAYCIEISVDSLVPYSYMSRCMVYYCSGLG